CCVLLSFAFIVPPTSPIYPLSLHDALPIYSRSTVTSIKPWRAIIARSFPNDASSSWLIAIRSLAEADRRRKNARCRIALPTSRRSEEHTSELQSLAYLVCRLLLEKKKQRT